MVGVATGRGDGFVLFVFKGCIRRSAISGASSFPVFRRNRTFCESYNESPAVHVNTFVCVCVCVFDVKGLLSHDPR